MLTSLVRARAVRLLVPLLSLLGIPALAQVPNVKPTERPFLWLVEGKTPCFIYGTIHLPDARVLTLPPVVEQAIERCDALQTEIPFDMATLVEASARALLPENKTLADVVPRELYARVAAYAKAHGVAMTMLDRVRPWAVATQLVLMDYMKPGMAALPLDMALYQKAQAAGKEVGGLETPDEQLRIFETLTDRESVQLLDKSLTQLEKADKEGVKLVDKLLMTYLDGDEKKLAALMNEYLDPKDPLDRKLIALLITERDERMARRMAERMKAQPGKCFYFAVGAAHLSGETGVLHHLARSGIQTKRLSAADAGKLPPRAAGDAKKGGE